MLAQHGWEAAGAQLSALAARGEWTAMPALVSDEMLAEVAVAAPEPDLDAALRERYAGLLDRVTVYRPFGDEGI